MKPYGMKRAKVWDDIPKASRAREHTIAMLTIKEQLGNDPFEPCDNGMCPVCFDRLPGCIPAA